MEKVKQIYCDGSVSPYYGCVYCIIGFVKKKKIVNTIENKDMKKTPCSTDVEYFAVIDALTRCGNYEPTIIYTDNMQIVSDLNGYKTPTIVTMNNCLACKKILEQKPNIKIRKIDRELNPAGIYLDKRLGRLKASANSVFYATSLMKKKKKRNYVRLRK